MRAYFTIYEKIHETVRKYIRANKGAEIKIEKDQFEYLREVGGEDGRGVSYRSDKEEIKGKIKRIGVLIWHLLKEEGATGRKEYELLKRVFEEQYEIKEGE
jgi:hypothetical protein